VEGSVEQSPSLVLFGCKHSKLILWDFSSLVMSFTWHGERVTLQGMSAPKD
jgi:hypothetical protein